MAQLHYESIRSFHSFETSPPCEDFFSVWYFAIYYVIESCMIFVSFYLRYFDRLGTSLLTRTIAINLLLFIAIMAYSERNVRQNI